MDPTRLGHVRRKFAGDLRKQFLTFWARIRPTLDTDPTFLSPVEQVRTFNDLVVSTLRTTVLSRLTRASSDSYMDEGVRKGLERSWTDAHQVSPRNRPAGLVANAGNDPAAKPYFLKSTFAKKSVQERLAVLREMTWTHIEGVTADMGKKLSVILAEGISNQKAARTIAAEMTQAVDMSVTRAELIAQTELTRAHADGQLFAMEEMGVEGVGSQAEWKTSGAPCDVCAPMRGVVLTVAQARGLIPRHPRCKCAWVPFGHPSMADVKPKVKPAAVSAAVGESQLQGGDGLTWTPTLNIPFNLLATLELALNRQYVRDSLGRFAHVAGGTGHAKAQAKGIDTNPALGLPDINKLQVLGPLGGSTGATLTVDEHGKKWVYKSHNKEHLESEVLADHLYAAMGVRVPKSGMVGGAKLSQFLEGKTLGHLHGADLETANKNLAKHFAADAFLGNWDVVGMSKDNMLVTTDGHPVRIDNGGALSFRAMGKKKLSSEWGPTVHELETMRDKGKNPNAAAAFGHLTDADVKAQIHDLLGKKQAILAACTDADVKAVLSQRLDYMEQWAKGKVSPTPVAHPTPHVTPPSAAVPTTPKVGSSLHSGAGLGAYIARKKGSVKFTDLQLEKIAHINPDGSKGGVVKVPQALGDAQIEHLKSILPPGTQIKKVNASAAKIGLKPAAVPAGTPTPVPTPIAPKTPVVLPPVTKPQPIIQPTFKVGDKFKDTLGVEHTISQIDKAAGVFQTDKLGDIKMPLSDQHPHLPLQNWTPSGPGPLPATYGGLKPGHTYINTAGVKKVIATVEHKPDGKTYMTFVGEIGTGVMETTKAFKGKDPNAVTPPPTGPASVPIPKKKGKGKKSKVSYVPDKSKYIDPVTGIPKPLPAHKPIDPDSDFGKKWSQWSTAHPPAPAFQTDSHTLPPIPSGGTVQFTSYKDVPEYGKGHEEWAKKLPAGQADAISSWKGSASSIRKAIINGDTPPGSTAANFLDAISSSKPYSGVVYRGLSDTGSGALEQLIHHLKTNVGGEYSDSAPHCMTPNATVGASFSGGSLLLRIQTRTGRPIHKVGNSFTNTGTKAEMEVVGMPRTRYKIIGYHENVTVTHTDGSKTVKYVVDLQEIV